MNKTELWIFFSYLLIIALITKPYSYSDNEGSRFNTIKSLVEHKTFAWNDLAYYYVTDDKILINGKLYSDKQPMFAFLSAPMYFLLYSLGITFDKYPGLVPYLLKVFIVGGATAYLLVLFYRILEKEEKEHLQEKTRLLLTLGLGFSTLLFTYATAFNTHSIVALLLFAAFVLFMKQQREEKTNLFWLGFLVGLAAAIDLVAGAFFILGYALYFFFLTKIENKKRLLFCLGILLPLALHFYFNYLILGNPFLPAYAYPQYYKDAGTWQNETNLPGFYTHSSFFALLKYTFHTTFGARGIFPYSPALFIGFLMLCFFVFKKKEIHYLPLFFAILGIIGYYSIYTSNYGGSSYGSRYLLPVIPILFYFCRDIFTNTVFSSQKWKFLFYCFLFFGFIIAFVGAFNPWVNHGEGLQSISFVASLHWDITYNSGIHYLLHWLGIA